MHDAIHVGCYLARGLAPRRPRGRVGRADRPLRAAGAAACRAGLHRPVDARGEDRGVRARRHLGRRRALPENERNALAEMVRAAQVMDGLFLEQVWAGNATVLTQLAGDRTPEGEARLHYFLINKGPWSRLDDNESFLRSGRRHSGQAAAGELLSGGRDARRSRQVDLRTDAARRTPTRSGFFSVIRRGNDGRLIGGPLQRRTTATRSSSRPITCAQAAALTTQPTLKKYPRPARRRVSLERLLRRATSRGWSSTRPIEPTIGPYETYEDEWFGYKAAFEAFITLRDDAETKKLDVLSAELQGLENALPIDPEVPQPEARRPRADARRQRRHRVGRRQPRRPDGGVQPAERRPRHQREGLEARDAEERAGREVREGAGADRRASRWRRPSARGSRSTRSSRTSSCTS